MRPSLRLLLLGLLLAVVVTGGVVAVGTLRSDPEPSPPDEPFATTALEDFDAAGLVVQRASFCGAIDPRQVAAALGADADSERAWDNGDRIKVSRRVRDVVHEFGCEFVAGDVVARAWVFAPPVDGSRGRQLVKAVASPDGSGRCSDLEAADFGSPSVQLLCERPGSRAATYAGLFGDAWLTCQLEVPASVVEDELTDRSGRWCVGVALAASSEEAVEG